MNLQKMMKQAQEMQTKIGDLQTELEGRTMEGSSGGGMVKAFINGKGIAQKIEIDDSLIDVEEKEMLEDLIVAAFNDAKEKVEDTFQEEMQKVAGGMGLPPGMKLPF